MPVTATSDLAKAADELKNMIAAAATFQSITGAANSTAAKAFIDIGETAEGDVPTQPRCLIQFNEDDHLTESVAAGMGGIASGQLVAVFSGAYVSSTSAADHKMTWRNHAGAIKTELLDADEGLILKGIDGGNRVTLPDDADSDGSQLIKVALVIQFGLEGVSA